MSKENTNFHLPGYMLSEKEVLVFFSTQENDLKKTFENSDWPKKNPAFLKAANFFFGHGILDILLLKTVFVRFYLKRFSSAKKIIYCNY